MNMVPIIEKKKLGHALSAEEIDFFVNGAATGSVPDYQLAALLMAIRLNGMNREETALLSPFSALFLILILFIPA